MATAFSFAQGLAPRLPAMNDAAAIAQNLVSIQAASTQQALSIEMMRRNAEAERGLVTMLQQSAEQTQALLPAGQGQIVDRTA